ncbi:AAA family ATPase, partial [bacterium]
INQRIVRNPQIHSIEIPMPDFDERLEFINHILKNQKVEIEMSIEQLANITAGLRRIQIESLFRQASKTNQKISYQLIKDKKKGIIEGECFGLVELIEPKHNLDTVGGMFEVKNYLRRIITNIKDGNYNRVPMGIFFVGPMGTGKTFVAEAFAGECGLTCLKLKNFRDKWVGTTEANLEKILNMVKALGSVLIIMDEVDRALGGGNDEGDSGTSSRVYARIKEFMSDTTNRGKILWLIMSNRPDKLDIDLMNKAAFELLNYTDFSCFSKSNTQTFTNNCKIVQAIVEEQNGSIVFTIEADRFLRNMVRAIVGTLVRVGKNEINIDDFKAIIDSKNRSNAGQSVPACGLFLVKVEYPFIN